MADGEGTRRGGRAARRALRVDAPVVHKPTLTRNIPAYEVADEEGVELIHLYAMRIVEEVGVDFRDAESLDIWRGGGAELRRIGRGGDRRAVAGGHRAVFAYTRAAAGPGREGAGGEPSPAMA